MTARDTLNAAMSEADFQSRVIARAKARGWMVHHARPSLNRSGKWSTAIQGHKGFPDLVLAHPDYGIVIAELKTSRGRLTDAQRHWVLSLGGAYDRTVRSPLPNARWLTVAVWRPADWPTITRIIDGDTP